MRAIERGGYVAGRVFFTAEPDAIGAGYRPCAICLPGAHAKWKAAIERCAPGQGARVIAGIGSGSSRNLLIAAPRA